MAESSRDALAVQAKRQIDGMSLEQLTILLPFLFLSVQDLRDQARILHATGNVRDSGHGEVHVIYHGGNISMIERLLKEKRED